jgi:hypothetical protein
MCILRALSPSFYALRKVLRHLECKGIDLNRHLMPRLGLFWFVNEGEQHSRFLSFSRSWDEVPEIGGFKTLDEGHVDIWPSYQRQYPFLRSYEYEAFPRGRVNWRAEDKTWLLLLDPKLNSEPFTSHVIEAWRLPVDRLTILTDPHYRSCKPVNPAVRG